MILSTRSHTDLPLTVVLYKETRGAIQGRLQAQEAQVQGVNFRPLEALCRRRCPRQAYQVLGRQEQRHRPQGE